MRDGGPIERPSGRRSAIIPGRSLTRDVVFDESRESRGAPSCLGLDYGVQVGKITGNVLYD